MSFLLPSLASSSRSAASARPLLAAASLRRSKADAKAKPAPIKKTSGPPVDLGDSSTDTLKRVRPEPLLYFEEDAHDCRARGLAAQSGRLRGGVVVLMSVAQATLALAPQLDLAHSALALVAASPFLLPSGTPR